MSLSRKDDDTLNREWSATETVSGVRRAGSIPITPEALYDLVSKTHANVAIVNMGGTWVYGRMVALSEVAEDARVRRLGEKYGIEVIVESTSWSVLVGLVLKNPREAVSKERQNRGVLTRKGER